MIRCEAETAGHVHVLYANLPGESDDYIASPKLNGWRSLHTDFIGPYGKVVEVQIRTRDMHEKAERGVCSHSRYKGLSRKSRMNTTIDLCSLNNVLRKLERIEQLPNVPTPNAPFPARDRIPDCHFPLWAIDPSVDIRSNHVTFVVNDINNTCRRTQ